MLRTKLTICRTMMHGFGKIVNWCEEIFERIKVNIKIYARKMIRFTTISWLFSLHIYSHYEIKEIIMWNSHFVNHMYLCRVDFCLKIMKGLVVVSRAPIIRYHIKTPKIKFKSEKFETLLGRKDKGCSSSCRSLIWFSDYSLRSMGIVVSQTWKICTSDRCSV